MSLSASGAGPAAVPMVWCYSHMAAAGVAAAAFLAPVDLMRDSVSGSVRATHVSCFLINGCRTPSVL